MKRVKGQTHSQILAELGGPNALKNYYSDASVDALRPGYMMIRQWIAKEQIPVWHWGTLIEAAKDKGFRLTIEDLWKTSQHK